MSGLALIDRTKQSSDPWPQLWPFLPERVVSVLKKLPPAILGAVEEVRLRAGRPLVLTVAGQAVLAGPDGTSREPAEAVQIDGADMQACVELISGSSMYALEEELRRGFLTLPGGHRVGLAGQAVLNGGKVRALKHLAGLNIRVAREVKGVAGPLVPQLYDQRLDRIRHTILVSPPGCGKTTVLRDLVRLVSGGVASLHLPGRAVGLVDERSEVAGCYRGLPRLDVGPNTDILDNCPKAEGLMMFLRSMGPRVLATDEIGQGSDVDALLEAQNAGVSLLTTAHAGSALELARRPALQRLLAAGAVERVVLLGRAPTPGTVQEVYGGWPLEPLEVKVRAQTPGSVGPGIR
ncbi:MAG TPA: stage III sporulation protein AA [Spirochaetia bacterium]|nr:stage III sporulation protein AA [Spirochaetia bacterium]